MDVKEVLLLHGGAGTWKAPKERLEKALKDIEDACIHGWRFLKTGSAIEAVTEAIAYMEDSGSFNAGTGSVLNVRGYREMDAGIMDGSTMDIGAVAAIRYPRNPIRLAKLVLEKTDHVLLAGSSADDLARESGLEEIKAPSEYVLERYRDLLKKYLKGERSIFRKNLELINSLKWFDTVGAVALDSSGRLVAGVSTGGVWLKLPGRVGDSAIPGAGFYADKNIAISSTGIGEVIIKTMPGIRIAFLVEQGYSLEKSMELVIDYISSAWGTGNTGIIGVDRKGRHHIVFNTKHIMVSYKDSEKQYAKLLSREQ